MKNMTLTSIKATMKQLYIRYVETNERDHSYSELWDSLRTLKNLDLLPYETWKKVVDYDHYLFQNIDKIMEEERKV